MTDANEPVPGDADDANPGSEAQPQADNPVEEDTIDATSADGSPE